jgi:hypothetical protein
MVKSLANALLAMQIVLIGSFLLLPLVSAEAAINEQIPFYGTLQNTSGANLSGTYDMVVRFYDASSGGTLLDTSTHTAANGNPVTVSGGEFNILLGSGTGNTLDGINFNSSTIYVGLTIGTDSEMTPRERLGSAAYSFNTDEIDGYDSLELLRLNATNTISYNSGTPLLTIQQLGTGDILNILDGVAEIFTILDGGNVGIGNTNPGSRLSVTGDISVSGAYRDTSGDAGTVGQVLLSTLTGTDWTATSSLGFLSNTAGDWTGTFDGQQGSYYLTNSFSTTSANYWETLQTTRTADDLTNNSIEDLSDVTAMTENFGDLLYWNGSAWADIATSSLGISGGGSLFTDGGATTYLTSLTDNLSIGTTTSTAKLSVHGAINISNKAYGLLIGGERMMYASTTNQSVALGRNAGATWNGAEYGIVAIGYDAGRFSSTTNSFENTYIGIAAGRNDVGWDNTIVGAWAGNLNSGNENSIFGAYAAENNTGNQNFIAGYLAGNSNTGNFNNLIGEEAGLANTGNYNDILGFNAGANNSSYENVIIGYFAGENNTDYQNVLIGSKAGRNNAGPDNVMLGWSAGHDNTATGSVMIGHSAGFYNIGLRGTFLGYEAGFINNGDYAVSLGYLAGSNNSGDFNNFLGYQAGLYNNGDYNNFIGYMAGNDESDGDYNDFMGYQAGLYINSTSTVAIGGLAIRGGVTTAINVLNTVALGYRAGYNIRSGADNNIFLGYQAGDNITTGDNNIFIGYDIDHISPALSNRLNIGNLIFGTGLDGTGTTLASGNVGIGTSTPVQKLQVRGDIRVGTTGTNGCLENYGGGVIGGTCSSDERLKIDVEEFSTSTRSYLEGIVALKPVTYRWNNLAKNLYSKDSEVTNIGLVAQNVEAVFPELVSENKDGYRQVDFTSLPFYIIEAVKELWFKVSGLEEKVKEIDELERRIERLESLQDVNNNSNSDNSGETTPDSSPKVAEPLPEPEPWVDELDIPERVVPAETMPEPASEEVITS